MSRPSWDSYFMEITDKVATRSTCSRRQVGAIIVLQNRILTTGYNGAPSGLAHCIDVGCMRDKLNIPSGQRQELCRGIHAEQNALIQAARFGIALEGATIYVTNQPCITCAKLIINSGIIKVVYNKPYPDEYAMEFFNEAKIEVIQYGGW